MTIGEKIKRIRTFRKMTQKKLGLAIGFSDRGADNRIAQYETNYRTPKAETLLQIATVLNVSPINFSHESVRGEEVLLETFFWLEEEHPQAIQLFHLVNAEEVGSPSPPQSNSEDLPPPVGMWFGSDTLNLFMREWLLRKKDLNAGRITGDEYFEWKIGWPYLH